MQTEVMFAGFGGQGILLSAKILAHMALEAGKEVIWIPSYGPEMRGGTAYCMVIISDQAIGSPVVKNPGHLVAMNRPSLEKFASGVKAGGVILINQSLIPVDSGRKDVFEIRVPVTEMAVALGSIKSANIIALSAFTAASGIADIGLLKQCIQEEFAGKPDALRLNLAAMEAGLKQGDNHKTHMKAP